MYLWRSIVIQLAQRVCWYRIRYTAKSVFLRYLDLEYYYNVQLRYDFISTKYQASIQFTYISKLIVKIINMSETQLHFSRCVFVVFYEKQKTQIKQTQNSLLFIINSINQLILHIHFISTLLYLHYIVALTLLQINTIKICIIYYIIYNNIAILL